MAFVHVDGWIYFLVNAISGGASCVLMHLMSECLEWTMFMWMVLFMIDMLMSTHYIIG